MKKTDLASVLTFCIFIGALTIWSIFTPVRTFSETENRTLEPRPSFTLSALFDGSYTSDYETFITDQFVLRDRWISLKTLSERLLGKKESGGVYFGADGYLFEKDTPDPERIEKNCAAVERFVNDEGAKRNVRVLIAPTALLTLEDKLPAHAPVWEQAEMLDRLAELPGFVDLRPVFAEHADEQLYYRTDHHWTTNGAYYAYAAVMDSLGIEPAPRESLRETLLSDGFYGTLAAKVNTKVSPDRLILLEPETPPAVTLDYNMGQSSAASLLVPEKLETRDKYGVFLGGNDPIVDISTSVKNGRTLLVVKDSYAHCILPLLVSHYERIVCLDLRHMNLGAETYLSEFFGADDVLILYNAAGFADDRNVTGLVK